MAVKHIESGMVRMQCSHQHVFNLECTTTCADPEIVFSKGVGVGVQVISNFAKGDGGCEVSF